jgi:hypothetical protein
MSAVADRRVGDGSTSSAYALANDTNFTDTSGVTTDFGSDSENATAINTALSEANAEFEIKTLSAPGQSYDGQEYYVDANGTWQGNLPKNTITETLANWFTPLDNAKYENGQLINSSTGESLAGGGTTKNVFGFDDTIYGVADDFSNNIVDTTDMTQNQINAANLTYEDKPPSALSYAASRLFFSHLAFALVCLRLSAVPAQGPGLECESGAAQMKPAAGFLHTAAHDSPRRQ